MLTTPNEPAIGSSEAAGPELATTNVLVAPGVSANARAVAVPGVSAIEAGRESTESPVGDVEPESTVWEGRYSCWNFLVRAIAAALLGALWLWLAIKVWSGSTDYEFLKTMVSIAAVAFWVYLGYKVIRAWQSHHYRLTTRRLFVSNGFFRRRVDQIELKRVKDLYVQQTMISHWLDVGTVIVVSSEETLPRASLVGVNRPQVVMDLIWQYTRREHNQKTTAIEHV
jgi:Bacterial PH domain